MASGVEHRSHPFEKSLPPRRRRKLRLTYTRQGWHLNTSPKVCFFASLEEVQAYLAELRRRRSTEVYARLEERSRSGWREVPELARFWAESAPLAAIVRRRLEQGRWQGWKPEEGDR